MIFGPEDILINNIAWLLRRFPVFAVPESGEYRLQPIFVEDMAELAVNLGHRSDKVIVDAVGPETFTFNELLEVIARTVGSKTKFVHVPPGLALFIAKQAGRMVGDVVLTKDEVDGLLDNLLVSPHTPTGATKLSDWLHTNSDSVGVKYASELKRHYR